MEERLLGRAKTSGNNRFNINIGRSDDNPETIKKRLDTYVNETWLFHLKIENNRNFDKMYPKSKKSNFIPNQSVRNKKIQALCSKMCPEDEYNLRTKHNMIHQLEKKKIT